VIFHVLTLFPGFFRGPFEHGVVGKGIERGLLQVRIHDLRQWTYDRHRSADDRPFGGGEGMVLKPEPVFLAAESVFPARDRARQRIALLAASGPLFDQAAAMRLSGLAEVLLICGRYEGVDERVSEALADEEISIGDYVLSGGELAAAVVVDAVARLIPGVLGNQESARNESFADGSLDYPHYTRPACFRGLCVPEALSGGHHADAARWRRQAALEKTARLRPDLLARNPGAGRELEMLRKKG
jgi:tRNA (guanine37-N1)-methyltransferase